jgi:uncharacterized protein YndB with AHSA1/START domain
MKKITVTTTINCDIVTVWNTWNKLSAIQKWYHASDDWECTKAINDFRPAGSFCYTLSAKDKSTSFELKGNYTLVKHHSKIWYTLEDGRKVAVIFTQEDGAVTITEEFMPESENTHEMQLAGWQAILTSFKQYVEKS